MHESSLVRNLLSQVDDLLDQHEAESATEITLEIGPLSGVEPALMRSAFAELSTDSRSEGAAFIIKDVPLAIVCRNCEAKTELKEMLFRCGECGSGSVQVVSGDFVQLNSISFEQPTTPKVPCDA